MRVLANIAPDERKHVHSLAKAARGVTFIACTQSLTPTSLNAALAEANADAAVCTNPSTLLAISGEKKASLDDWRGSVLNYTKPVLVLNPLRHTVTKPEGGWLLKQDMTKLARLGQTVPEFNYEVFHDSRNSTMPCASAAHWQHICTNSRLCAVDIESTIWNTISCIGFSFLVAGDIWTLVISMDSQASWNLANSLLLSPVPKVFHNGAYDCTHLLRFGLATRNYAFDTEYAWHAWYAELPKNLSFISSIFLPDHSYWKDDAWRGNDLHGLWRYNAMDVWRTLRVATVMLATIPGWALRQALLIQMRVYSNIQCHLLGWPIDEEKRKIARDKAQAEVDQDLTSIRAMVGDANFNPASPQQLAKLFYGVYGAPAVKVKGKLVKSTEATALKKLAAANVILNRFVTAIMRYRKNAKAISTYYDAQLIGGRLHYTLNTDGTTTDRMSSSQATLFVDGNRSKHYGAQIQNIPPYMKYAMCALPGYVLIDKDKSQSEARCVAYLSGDQNLRAALEGDEDFYCATAFNFFGRKINKDDKLRQITKKIIHGSNYIMGEETFIDSAGESIMYEAITLLGLAPNTPLNEVSAALLATYHKTFQDVPRWWTWTERQLKVYNSLVTPDGWKRIFFNQKKRAGVAHQPQHLSVAGINKAYTRIFFDLVLPGGGDILLLAQVHDSITVMAKDEQREFYSDEMERIMDQPQETAHGTMRIPLDTSYGFYWKTDKSEAAPLKLEIME